ncbi:MAG TPA: c-type cytochrome [Flavobacteriales bacterium]|nr:c-type cytochrome [Flavobacteriales bacterium]
MKPTIAILSSVLLLVFACGSADAPVELGAEGGMSKGEQIYKMNCSLCHGGDGKLGFNGAKDLTKSILTKQEMVVRVREGKGTMTPFKNTLTAKDIDAVVDHVRELAKKK